MDFLNPVLIKAYQEGIASMDVCGYSENQKITICAVGDNYIMDRTNQHGAIMETLEAFSVRAALEKLQGMYLRAIRA